MSIRYPALLIFPFALLIGACSAPTVQDSRDVYVQVLDEQAKETAQNLKFTPSLVSLIHQDPRSGNFLFRGNLPIEQNSFSYEDLVKALKNATPGGALPAQFFLVDISLLNRINPQEDRHLTIEQRFWQQNPQLGKLLNHPVYGSLSSPNSYPNAVRKKLEKIPTLSNTDALVDSLENLLQSSQANNVPLVLYIHCEAGKDRTGEVAASYAMKYLGSSYADAYANAKRIARRDISTLSRNELQWYAYFLKDIKQLATIGAIK